MPSSSPLPANVAEMSAGRGLHPAGDTQPFPAWLSRLDDESDAGMDVLLDSVHFGQSLSGDAEHFHSHAVHLPSSSGVEVDLSNNTGTMAAPPLLPSTASHYAGATDMTAQYSMFSLDTSQAARHTRHTGAPASRWGPQQVSGARSFSSHSAAYSHPFGAATQTSPFAGARQGSSAAAAAAAAAGRSNGQLAASAPSPVLSDASHASAFSSQKSQWTSRSSSPHLTLKPVVSRQPYGGAPHQASVRPCPAGVAA